MACENPNERKCFTYLWKIENAIYCWQKENEPIASPAFEVEEIGETRWKLELYPFYYAFGVGRNKMAFLLIRQPDSKCTELVRIEYQVALLALDGTVLSLCKRKQIGVSESSYATYDVLPVEREEVFIERRSDFLPLGTLMVQCRIWKCGSEFAEDIHWVSRTRLGVTKRSFLWKVGNFRSLKPQENHTYEIKSLETREEISISVCLYLNAGLNFDEINIVITPKDPKIIYLIFQLSIVDALGNTTLPLENELWFDVSHERRHFLPSVSKAKLMEKNDIFILRCECYFSAGIILEEIERVISDGAIFGLENFYLAKEMAFSNLEKVLHQDLKSLLNERIQSDIKLKTSSKTFHVHKCILSARSPVFKAMFSNDMREKINDCVDIEDLNDDTVSRMFRYIYCAEVEELEWESAIELYEASDKYEILTLKDVCSSYLKKHLCKNNACETLVLADLHQDQDLKVFVQNFIFRSCKDIIFSEKWEQLMETNLKLAADTMRLKFKE